MHVEGLGGGGGVQLAANDPIGRREHHLTRYLRPQLCPSQQRTPDHSRNAAHGTSGGALVVYIRR